MIDRGEFSSPRSEDGQNSFSENARSSERSIFRPSTTSGFRATTAPKNCEDIDGHSSTPAGMMAPRATAEDPAGLPGSGLAPGAQIDPNLSPVPSDMTAHTLEPANEGALSAKDEYIRGLPHCPFPGSADTTTRRAGPVATGEGLKADSGVRRQLPLASALWPWRPYLY